MLRQVPHHFMRNHMHPPDQWAQSEFGPARLGDPWRTKRLVNIATHLAASPGGTLPQAFPDWAELKAPALSSTSGR